MDLYLKSDARLEASVSFGRFEKDMLSWEKWSSFSPNKYLEEVGSLSTPGSVAQKKAYFEAHYKKIAAQKAEALEQEKPLDSCVSGFVSDSSEVYDEQETNDCANLVDQVLQESCLSTSPYEENGKAISLLGSEPEACNTTSVDNIIAVNDEEVTVGSAVAVNDGSPGEEVPLDELNGDLDHSESNVMSNAGLNAVDPCQQNFRNLAEKQSEQTNVPEKHSEDSNMNSTGNEAQKDTQLKKEKCLTGTRKKVGSLATRGLQDSKNSKSTSKCAPTSTTQYLKKKTGTPQTQTKSSVVGYKKGQSPTSLHMSLSSGRAKSLGNHSVMSNSLIMEKLGDKDIVRRAFRAFQKRDDASSSPAKLSIKHESPATVKPKMSIAVSRTPGTPVKVNERLKKDFANRTPSGTLTRSNPLPSGSLKTPTLDKKNGTGFSSSTLTNDSKAERRKEFLKKLEANSIARASQNTHHNRSLNSKVDIQN